MAEEDPAETHPLLGNNRLEDIPVYPIIHMIRQDMLHFIDTPLTYDALLAPDLTYTLVKPLEDKYANIQRKGNFSVVFCFLLNRVNFMRDQDLITSSLSQSRAALCELMATRLLRLYAGDILELAFVMTTSWPVYSGADDGLLKQLLEDLDIEDVEERVGNAIEMAIIGKAKRFIKSTPCQRVIDSIWSGKCVYQAESSHSMISDTYKRTPIHFYDPHKAPMLDHYRLKVPAIRSVLEYLNFLALFVLFVLTLELSELNKVNVVEIIFMVYALGFSLEKLAAMQEHGVSVYFTGTWNGFDLALITIFVSYASLRLYGVHHDSLWARSSGIDCLALAACLLFPRLAFVTLKNNLMVLSLRAMIVQFIILMLIAVFCFAGFLYALWTLARNEANYSATEIFWWMADLWFGLDASGFMLATTFHRYFGPILMVLYTCLSNTLLLTVLVSNLQILSHTFSTISEDAQAEALFRRAVLTIEGVKADYLFSYQPPVNVFALLIMLPASYLLSPRWFHKVNVFMIRLTSFPILLAVAYYERQAKHIHATTFTETVSGTAERVIETLPRSIKRLTFFEGFFAGKLTDIDVIFDIDNEMMQPFNQSALDVQEPDNVSARSATSGLRTQRRTSHSTANGNDRRVSISKAKPMTIVPSSSSARSDSSKDGNERPGSRSVRQRLTSMVQRGADLASTFTSPLAQIYQPLVVDDDIVDGDQDNQTAQPSISYGPVTRRRLSSMHRFPSIAPDDHPNLRKTSFQRGQGGMLDDSIVQESPRSREDLFDEDVGSSRAGPTLTSPVPDPASTVLDGDTTPGISPSTGLILERMSNLEENQKRLETLILQLSQELKSLKT